MAATAVNEHTIKRNNRNVTVFVAIGLFLVLSLASLISNINTHDMRHVTVQSFNLQDVTNAVRNQQRWSSWPEDTDTLKNNTSSTFHSEEPSSSQSEESPKKYNVLFIVSDDLRPQMNAYKGEHFPNPFSTIKMHTPNLDALANRSLVLLNAHAQFGVCGPSRASFMTGRRPDTTLVWDLYAYWRTRGGNFTTIPQFFKEQGYITSGFGKIFHQGKASDDDDPISWTQPYHHSEFEWQWAKAGVSWRAVPQSMRVHTPLPDEDVTRLARENLRRFAPRARTGEQPFFLGVGFHKPHMPFVCPAESFEHYPLELMEPVQNYFFPKHFPDIHKQLPEPAYYTDLHRYNCSKSTVEECCLPPSESAIIRRAYFACVTYIDTLVGELLQELDDLGLRDSTVVTFIGDHGFHLGENAMYGKHTNMEHSTHVPFVVSVPEQTDGGIESSCITELVDLFPTLVEAAGFPPLPVCPLNSTSVRLCTDGTSLMPLINNPERPIKEVAVSQIMRIRSMGYTIRTDRYRYSEWPVVDYNASLLEVEPFQLPGFWDELHALEMYDHQMDPEENDNLVKQKRLKETIARLRKLLHDSVPLDVVAKPLYKYLRYFQ